MLRNKKIIKSVSSVLILVFCGACLSESGKVSEPLPKKKEVIELFDTAKIIKLKYRPVYQLGPRPTSKEDILSNWLYSASRNCVVTCARSAKKLKDYLVSGVMAESDCPAPFFAALEFFLPNGEVGGRVFIHASGRCFSYDNKSYVTDKNFTEFVDENNISVFGDFTQPPSPPNTDA